MNILKNHKTWYSITGVWVLLLAFGKDHCSVDPMDVVNLLSSIAPVAFALVAGLLHGKSQQIQQVANVVETVAKEESAS